MDTPSNNTDIQLDMRSVQDYYSRDDIQKAILDLAKNREIAGVFKTGSFGNRPNVLVYPNDIIEMVKTGIIEFHSSLERWSNPMALRSDNYNELRIGWDLILDIDCKEFEHARLGSMVICKALEKHSIKNYSLKYTGGKGFHIGIPWESIPNIIDYKKAVQLFPDVARHMGLYLKSYTKDKLGDAFLKKYKPEELAKQTGKPLGKILDEDNIDPFQIIDIDPVLISSRHLFRMPYSINRKTGLVSVPIRPEDLSRFRKDDAHPDMVKVEQKFLEKWKVGEANILVAEAVDWWARKQIAERKSFERKVRITKAIPQELFPPCVQNVREGLADGRKRSVFILINFLSTLKWKREDMENLILDWNKKNKPPLPENYIRGQLRWHKNRGKIILPPNCLNEGFYQSFGACKPDNFCGKDRSVKNPVNYPFRKMDRKRPREKAKRRVDQKRSSTKSAKGKK